MKKDRIMFFCITLFTLMFLFTSNSIAKANSFAVISDPHFYDTDLGTTGAAFEAYLMQDRKLLRESEAIMKTAIGKILWKRPDFVIVSGDLTKDGEMSGHQKLAGYLAKLEACGIKVYVVPGNHDINNPHAVAYDDNITTPVDSVTPEDFADIYGEYGYGEAIDRDPNSLSYVAEPVEGTWLIAIDSCKYDDNLATGHPETSGAISQETLSWILEKLEQAQDENITVMGFMHHGVTEHYFGQSQLFGEYIIDDWQTTSATLATAGLKIIFTGHYHANDITLSAPGEGGLYDIETGSLITYPCPIRFGTLHNGQAAIHTEFVKWIRYDTGGVPFPEYARDYLYQGLLGIATYTLMTDYELPLEVAQLYAPYVANAFMAHYAGDEPAPDPATLAFIQTLLTSGDPTMMFLGGSLLSLYTDLPVADTYGLLLEPIIVPITGDLDGDGDIDLSDISIILFHLNQPAGVYPAADMDNDGTITFIDAIKLFKFRT